MIAYHYNHCQITALDGAMISDETHRMGSELSGRICHEVRALIIRGASQRPQPIGGWFASWDSEIVSIEATRLKRRFKGLVALNIVVI